ncbi:MAG: alkaline phosphatase family protein [Methanotrichaceae archaeon]
MRLLIFLLILVGSAQGLTEIQVSDLDNPAGAVVLVVDGLGSSYVYPEYRAFDLDGHALGKAVLFNLTSGGARVLDIRVPVPSSDSSYSVLVTGCSLADPSTISTPGATLFDVARDNGFLCMALLQRSDQIKMVLEQDGVLFWDDEPIVGARGDVSPEIISLLQNWQDKFSVHTVEEGVGDHVKYNVLSLDAATDLVQHLSLSSKSFLLMVNIEAVNRSGHDLGPEGYLEAIAGLDAPLGNLIQTCQENHVILLVTSDHGMYFPSNLGRGGCNFKYSSKMECLRVPAVFFGPGVDDFVLAGDWSQADLAPTLLDLLDLPQGLLLAEGSPMPVRERYDLEVRTINIDKINLYRNGDLVAKASGDSHYLFRRLERGAYTVESDKQMASVCMNGDQFLDLASDRFSFSDVIHNLHITRPDLPKKWSQKLMGAIMILVINLIGVVMIFRIIKKG